MIQKVLEALERLLGNTTIRSRMYGSAAAITVLLMLLAAIATYQFRRLGEQTEALSADTALFLGTSRLVDKASAAMRIPGQAAAGGGGSRVAYSERYQNLVEDVRQLTEMASTPARRAPLEDCLKKLETANAAVSLVFDHLEKGKKDDAMVQAIVVEEFASDVVGSLRRMNMDTTKALEQRMVVVKGNLNTPVRVLLAASAVIIVLSILVSFVVLRSMRPMKRIVEVLEAVSAGDYQQRIEIESRDEIGVMANAFNEMIGQIEAALAEVRVSAERVNKQAVERSEHEKQLAEQSRLRREERKRRLEGTMRAVTAATELAAQSSVDMKKSVTKAAESVATSSRDIGQVVSLMSNIAFKTHLLGLNAAVEAARAGEAGRGFEVVAGEVKTLASQATEGADSILGHLTAIRGGSEAATAAVAKMDLVVKQVNAISDAMKAAVAEQAAL